MNHLFDGYDAWQGDIPPPSHWGVGGGSARPRHAYAIGHLQPRGELFIAPGDEVYEGMIVGENSRENDMDVNITRRRSSQHACPPPTRRRCSLSRRAR